MSRWERLLGTIQALERQSRVPDEIILVADHNLRLSDAMESLKVGRVILHDGVPGCSGARNHGWQTADGELVAFIDDDAVPEQDWLERLVAPLEASPSVVATGGWVLPDGGNVAAWYPKELYWVFGCSWAGLEARRTLRNPIGASMAWRRSVLSEVGGFNLAIGHAGNSGRAIDDPHSGDDRARPRRRGAPLRRARAGQLHLPAPSWLGRGHVQVGGPERERRAAAR
jgi:GT2 family glycosyltransferase